MEDFYNILKNEYNFSEQWYLPSVTADSSGSKGISPWMASLSFPCAIVEMSTHMDNFPYTSGSAEMMKLAQEYYATCISELACINGWNND